MGKIRTISLDEKISEFIVPSNEQGVVFTTSNDFTNVSYERKFTHGNGIK
jgi:hypothetical protein